MMQLALFAALGGAGYAAVLLWRGELRRAPAVEYAAHVVSLGFLVASGILLYALWTLDFSVEYVASYTDRALDIFYRITAFWAGQAGSFLFWALVAALGGSLFALTRARRMKPETRLWFWLLFHGISAFFALLLTTWSNPFLQALPAPADGNGMNPLLQNPGMIIHPPLLFIGYAGFIVPGCAALAQCLSGGRGEEPWFAVSRPFTLFGWVTLTAGIILGAWWAYMELGWGGYWAWDPVENASLIPWLIGTAALHIGIVEAKRGKLGRTAACLFWLTTVSAFFATYLVRSGVVNSVHAFGDGGVGTPLLVFVLFGLAVGLLVPFFRRAWGAPLDGIESREGLLVLVSWVLIALAVIILCATLWPVISLLWSAQPAGLDAAFYNRVCLPLGAVLTALLAFCPWVSWKGGFSGKRGFLVMLVIFAASAAALWFFGYRKPTAFIAAAASCAVIAGAAYLCIRAAMQKRFTAFAAHGVHLGLAMLALGVAFSGPYKTEEDLTIAVGSSAKVGSYDVKLVDMKQGRGIDFDFLEARLEISRDGKVLGELAPQRRIYDKFASMQFSEADTIPSVGNELYASLLGTSGAKSAYVKVSVNPLVNWLWIGGTLMCLFPFFGMMRRRRESSDGTAA